MSIEELKTKQKEAKKIYDLKSLTEINNKLYLLRREIRKQKEEERIKRQEELFNKKINSMLGYRR